MGNSVKRLGIVGAGVMGQGILQVALQGGLQARLYDHHEDRVGRAIARVDQRLTRLVEKGKIDQQAYSEMMARAEPADQLAALADCDVVIEAVAEKISIKQELFQNLEAIVSADTVIATNTSSLLVAAIARACQHPARVAGMHFFNPVPLMKLVEIIAGPHTSLTVIDQLTELAYTLGRQPVVAKDMPGFIVNHAGRAYTTEAMRVLQEGVAPAEVIDAIMRDCAGFPMGPCELMDLTGIDVNYPVTRMIYDYFEQEPRLRTAFPHRALFEAGRFGRKTDHGHFRYDNAAPLPRQNADYAASARPAQSVYLIEPQDRLRQFAEKMGFDLRTEDDGQIALLAAPIAEDCAHMASRLGLDHRRLVAADLWSDVSQRVCLMRAPGADNELIDSVAARILANGCAVSIIHDSPGFIAQRIQMHIANVGCEMAQIGVATPHDIDLALQLGLNYPRGPLALAEHLGLTTLYNGLRRMQEITGDDRYRPTPWIRRRAQLGLPIHCPD